MYSRHLGAAKREIGISSATLYTHVVAGLLRLGLGFPVPGSADTQEVERTPGPNRADAGLSSHGRGPARSRLPRYAKWPGKDPT